MKKYLLSGITIIAFVLYAFRQTVDTTLGTPGISPVPQVTAPSPSVTAVTTPQVTSQTTPVSQRYKNGEFTGDLVDAYYGNVQIKAVIDQGKITDVQFLDYPHDRRTSVEINTYAMPYLKAEALQAQSSAVDLVSGATQTSLAFIQSLKSALQKAAI